MVELRKLCLHTLQPPSISKRRSRGNNIWEESRNAKGQVPTGGPTSSTAYKERKGRQQYRTHYLWQADDRHGLRQSHLSPFLKGLFKIGGIHVQIGRPTAKREKIMLRSESLPNGKPCREHELIDPTVGEQEFTMHRQSVRRIHCQRSNATHGVAYTSIHRPTKQPSSNPAAKWMESRKKRMVYYLQVETTHMRSVLPKQ